MSKYFKYSIYLYVLIGFNFSNAGSYDDFFKAIHFDRPIEVAQLIARGLSPNMPNEKGEPALLVAIKSDSKQSALLLAKHHDTRYDVVNAANETPLMLAALHNQMEVAEILIERGADVNRKGWTPLHYAATRGHTAMMRLLLEHSAYIDAESPNGTTPLMMAAFSGTPLSVKLLLEEGADPTLRNHAQSSALDFALTNGHAQSAFYIQVFTEAWVIREAGE